MKAVLKTLFMGVAFCAIAGGAIYLYDKCPERIAKQDKLIEAKVAQYIENNPKLILEKIAKSENFGETIKSFSTIGIEELEKQVANYLDNNPRAMEEYVRNNASFIADLVMEDERVKNLILGNVKIEVTEDEVTEGPNVEENNKVDENQKYKDNWDKMANGEVAPFIGPKDAKITVVEFFDFACGHCKALAPVLAELIKRNDDVKFVFNPLYFMTEHSQYAAKVSLAAFEKGKFLPVFEGIMTLPNMNEETINQILVDEGLNVDEVKKMIEEKKIRRGVQDIDALSQVLGINGVPMLFINGEPFYGRSFDDLQNKINSLR